MATHWLVVGAGGNTGRFWMAVLGGARWNVIGLVRPYQRDQFVNLHQITVDWQQPNGTSRATIVRDLYFMDMDSLSEVYREERYNVVLAVKSGAIAAALHELQQKLPGCIDLIIIPTNGLAGEQCAVATLGETRRIVSATLTYPCETGDRPGIVRVGSVERGIGFAALNHDDDHAVQCLVTNLMGRNLTIAAEWFYDYRSMKWTKLLLNLMGNVIPAIVDLDLADVYRHRAMCRLEMLAIDEIAHLLVELGIPLVGLPGYPLEKIRQLVQLAHLEHWFGWSGLPARMFGQKIVPKILTGRGGKLPSLLASLRRKRDGASIENLAREALLTAFSTPVHRFYPVLSTLGTILDQRWQSAEERQSDMTPDRLWAAYQQRVRAARSSLNWRLRHQLP